MIRTVVESKRGCGYRKQGGKYLISGSYFKACGKMPMPILPCPCCGGEIRLSRAYTWITTDYTDKHPCMTCQADGKPECVPFDGSAGKMMLIRVGKAHYPTPEDFIKEANAMGISRRLNNGLPKDFVVGETWVLLAHEEACEKEVPYKPKELKEGESIELNITPKITTEIVKVPGIFMAFKPESVEYVVKGSESAEELARLEKQGYDLVHVVPEEIVTAKEVDGVKVLHAMADESAVDLQKPFKIAKKVEKPLKPVPGERFKKGFRIEWQIKNGYATAEEAREEYLNVVKHSPKYMHGFEVIVYQPEMAEEC